MKKIIIVGANSYVGESFVRFIGNDKNYYIETVSTLGDDWRDTDFSGFSTVFYVSGIAHIKETEQNKDLYYKVNYNLVKEIAEKAKTSGIRQFIFMSTMSIYGIDTGVITSDTIPDPKSHYGKSKLMAEQALNDLCSDTFKVCILRPPMVYGKNCKGNFQSVLKIIKMSPVFPKSFNERSMIYIDNLSSFVKKAIDEELSGIFFPQNKEYMNTSYMAQVLADEMGKRILVSHLLGRFVYMIRGTTRITKKAFGSLVYKNTEVFNFDYCLFENEESLRKSV